MTVRQSFLEREYHMSDEVIREKIEELYGDRDSLRLSDWEMNFVESLVERGTLNYSPRQKEIVLSVYEKHYN